MTAATGGEEKAAILALLNEINDTRRIRAAGRGERAHVLGA